MSVYDFGRAVEEKATVGEVARELLEELKRSALGVARWTDSRQGKAAVRTTINDRLLHLPVNPYPQEVVTEKSGVVDQHVFARYGGRMWA